MYYLYCIGIQPTVYDIYVWWLSLRRLHVVSFGRWSFNILVQLLFLLLKPMPISAKTTFSPFQVGTSIDFVTANSRPFRVQILNKRWASLVQILNISRVDIEHILSWSWTSVEQVLCKYLASLVQILNISWVDHEQTLNTSWLQILKISWTKAKQILATRSWANPTRMLRKCWENLE